MNLEMINRGAAWAYKKYLKPPYVSEYIQAESEARDKGLGLWQQNNPESPWEFRNNNGKWKEKTSFISSLRLKSFE